MSNLSHSISLLIREGGRISSVLKFTGKDDKNGRARKLAGIIRAISILSDVKMKDELKEKAREIDKDLENINL